MSYFKKLNASLGGTYIIKIRESVKNGDYSTAILLQMGIIDALLRIEIRSQVKQMASKYYDNEDLLLGTLIDYFELLQCKPTLVPHLRKYNNLRRKILHHPNYYKNFDHIREDIKGFYNLGTRVIDEILNI